MSYWKIMNGTLCVVGDKFSAFALGVGAITMSDLLKRVRNGHFQPDGEPIRLVAGQGLKQHEIDLLRRLIATRGLRHHLIVDMDQDMPRAGRLEAHKHHPENVMVSLARQTGEGVFEADLLIDDRCEIMADHTTGQHIQGMAVVEAARQMFLVVTEQFYTEETSDRHYYFVIHQMDIVYQNFLFPVPATLRYEVLEAATDNPERLAFTARITIRQAGKDAASMAVRFTAFDEALIFAKEEARARRALEETIANLPPAPIRQTYPYVDAAE